VTKKLDFFTPGNLTSFHTRWMSLPASNGQDFHSKPVQCVIDRYWRDRIHSL
jgi:hypothetical protein